MSTLQGTTLGKYDITGKLGEGNMATVYLGNDPFNSRNVAIKVAHPEMLRDAEGGEEFRRMFFNEAKIAGMLKHPNMVAVYDAGVEGDVCYIAMEHVPGGATLKDHTKPGKLLPLEDVVQVVFKCAKALDHAHRKGVIHRDVKPANIMLTDDRDIKVVDFGIALVTRPGASGTHVQGYVGSPLYMSPEQVRQENISTQTDIFSIGVVLYELLTGKHPFIAGNLAAIIHRIASEEPVSIKKLRDGLPDILHTIMKRTLRKDPSQRYKTCMDMAGDLSLVFDQLSISDEGVSDHEKFNQVQDLKFFKSFNDAEKWEVINASQWLEFQPGQAIVTEGEQDSSFYILVSGEAVVRKGERELQALSQGECFGEMGFISRDKRSASIFSRSDVLVLKVSASRIERTSVNCQFRFQKVFLNTLVQRLRATTEKLT